MIRIFVTEIGWLGQLFCIRTSKSSCLGDLKSSSASHHESSNWVNSGSCDNLLPYASRLTLVALRT